MFQGSGTASEERSVPGCGLLAPEGHEAKESGRRFFSYTNSFKETTNISFECEENIYIFLFTLIIISYFRPYLFFVLKESP